MARTPRVWSSVTGPLDIDVSGVNTLVIQAMTGMDYYDIEPVMGVAPGAATKFYCGFFNGSSVMELGLRWRTQQIYVPAPNGSLLTGRWDHRGGYEDLGSQSFGGSIYPFAKQNQEIRLRRDHSGPGGQAKYHDIFSSGVNWFLTQPSFDATIGFVRLGQFGPDLAGAHEDTLYAFTGVPPSAAGETPTTTHALSSHLGTIFTANAAGIVCSGVQLYAEGPASHPVYLWEASGSSSPIAVATTNCYPNSWNEIFWDNGPVVLTNGATYYVTKYRFPSASYGYKTGTWPRNSAGGSPAITGIGGIVSNFVGAGVKPDQPLPGGPLADNADFLIGPICNRVTGGTAVPVYFDYVHVQDLDGPTVVYFSDFDIAGEPDHAGAVADPYVALAPTSLATAMGEMGGLLWPTADLGAGGHWDGFTDPGASIAINPAHDKLICSLPAGNADIFGEVEVFYKNSDYSPGVQNVARRMVGWPDGYGATVGFEIKDASIGDFHGDPPTVEFNFNSGDQAGTAGGRAHFSIRASDPAGFALTVSLPTGYVVGDPTNFALYPTFVGSWPIAQDTHYLIRFTPTEATGRWKVELSDDNGASWTTLAETPVLTDGPARSNYPVAPDFQMFGRDAADDGWSVLLDWISPGGPVTPPPVAAHVDPGTVTCLCLGDTALIDDEIEVTRRAFAQLGLRSADSVSVLVEVLDSNEKIADEIVSATLPFVDAQVALAAAPTGAKYRVSAGWYGNLLEPNRDAFCLVKTDGKLARAGLVGKRVRLSKIGT